MSGRNRIPGDGQTAKDTMQVKDMLLTLLGILGGGILIVVLIVSSRS